MQSRHPTAKSPIDRSHLDAGLQLSFSSVYSYGPPRNDADDVVWLHLENNLESSSAERRTDRLVTVKHWTASLNRTRCSKILSRSKSYSKFDGANPRQLTTLCFTLPRQKKEALKSCYSII